MHIYTFCKYADEYLVYNKQLVHIQSSAFINICTNKINSLYLSESSVAASERVPIA